MNHSRKAFIPAALVAFASIALIVYSFYASSRGRGHPPNMPAAGARPPGGEREEGLDPFTLFGTLAVVCGAVSFTWLRFKKKLVSPSPIVKKLAKLLYRVHPFTGWAALLLIAAHGSYFLVTKLNDHKIYTGLASFLILLALAGYGFLIKRVRNKWLRKAHFYLSLLWIPALLLHAGGSFLGTALATAAVWAAVWLLERATQPKPA
ncbi:hypothetical protein [Cohnella thermotolerans]|jgi:hypothetical protein|uniref:hypothetical protein n=1 Tax=Cohnella thermotolerans TaxID=329858 RepID=UPI00040E1506|nr:hypothetical protein [Cohnella thermotolerans]